ncbi:hypothetical protein FXO38_11676 [Capsicum annuum]|nr:hypothetical protein FXO38_11676 [Capsicum annuum]
MNVTESNFSIRDDCISIGNKKEQLHISKVTCGPRYGISVGSLGGNPSEKPVVGVFAKNCTFISTDNGVRIKTWPASHTGVVSDVHFEDIIVQNVSNLILIDQVYCPSGKCNKNEITDCWQPLTEMQVEAAYNSSLVVGPFPRPCA